MSGEKQQIPPLAIVELLPQLGDTQLNDRHDIRLKLLDKYRINGCIDTCAIAKYR